MGTYMYKHSSRYVGCAVIQCRKDCCVELIAILKNGSRIYIPACEQHVMQVHTAKIKLEEGVEPRLVQVVDTSKGEKVGLSLSELFYCGPEQSTQSPQEEQAKPETRVTSHWRWIEDFDAWMSAAGKVVAIKELEDKELEDAAILIRRANIKRRTKRVSWITGLEEIASPIKYFYPEHLLAVGAEDAYSKLDEFYEECRSRGILP